MSPEDYSVSIADINLKTMLTDWRWLMESQRSLLSRLFAAPLYVPVLVTANGDAFVQHAQAGSVHYLDTRSGAFVKVSLSLSDFHAQVTDRDFLREYFSTEMVDRLRNSGMALGANQVYSYKHPPCIGGKIEVENVEASDMEVHFSVAGQIHRQIRDLPEGAPIGRIKLR